MFFGNFILGNTTKYELITPLRPEAQFHREIRCESFVDNFTIACGVAHLHEERGKNTVLFRCVHRQPIFIDYFDRTLRR